MLLDCLAWFPCSYTCIASTALRVAAAGARVNSAHGSPSRPSSVRAGRAGLKHRHRAGGQSVTQLEPEQVGHPARAWRQAGIMVQAEHLLGQLLLSAPPVGCAVPALNGILQGLCAVKQFHVAELQLSGGACSTAVLHTWPRRGSVHLCNTLLAPQPASCARCLQPELMAALLYFCCLLLVWTASTSSGPACPLGLGSHEQLKMPRGHFRLITKMLPCDCLQ